MEVQFVVTLWQVIVALVVITSAFAVNTYMTKQNSTEVITLKNITKDVLTEMRAREIFVTKELYKNQMIHIDQSLADLKKQNETILDLLRVSK